MSKNYHYINRKITNDEPVKEIVITRTITKSVPVEVLVEVPVEKDNQEKVQETPKEKLQETPKEKLQETT